MPLRYAERLAFPWLVSLLPGCALRGAASQENWGTDGRKTEGFPHRQSGKAARNEFANSITYHSFCMRRELAAFHTTASHRHIGAKVQVFSKPPSNS